MRLVVQHLNDVGDRKHYLVQSALHLLFGISNMSDRVSPVLECPILQCDV